MTFDVVVPLSRDHVRRRRRPTGERTKRFLFVLLLSTVFILNHLSWRTSKARPSHGPAYRCDTRERVVVIYRVRLGKNERVNECETERQKLMPISSSCRTVPTRARVFTSGVVGFIFIFSAENVRAGVLRRTARGQRTLRRRTMSL